MRSLASGQQLSERDRKRAAFDALAGREIWIDGFNIIITLEVLLCKSILIRCMDETIRDLAEEMGCFEPDIRILRDVDRVLYDKELVITSDSVILDHCRSWVNLTAECVKMTEYPVFQVW